MTFIKENLFLVILVSLMLVVSGVGGFFIFSSNKEADKFEKQVEDIKNQMDAFTKSEFKLQPATVEQAQENREVAEERYKNLLDELVKKTAVPPSDADLISPISAKNRIEKACTKMEGMLAGNSVAYDTSMRHFTFQTFMAADRLPKKEEIPLILRNLEIVQEMIYLVSTSNVRQLNSIKRDDTLDATRRDLFNYIPFSLSVTGEMQDVKRLVNSFNNATYYYFVRAVTLNSDSIMTDGLGVTSKRGTKIDRLLLKKPTMVTATLQVDYVEFHDKE